MSDATKAVVLLSGGLDSTTVLAMALQQGYDCLTLAVSYGQRHSVELQAAAAISRRMGAAEHRQMQVDFAGIGGSALTDHQIDVPESGGPGIPITYVPARNTLMLALALGWAEVAGAGTIFIGVNAVDYSGYPDCRPEFIAAFARLAAGHAGRRRRGHPADPNAADAAEQSADYPARFASGRRLQSNRVLLPSRCGRAGVWTL